MPDSLIVGGLVGAIIGVIHARSIYSARAREAANGSVEGGSVPGGRAAYFALWTFLLWLVFGTYVFYLWLASLVIFGVYRLLKGREPVGAGR